MHSLSSDLLMIADLGLTQILFWGLIAAVWWCVFPPTICGLVPGCLAMFPAMGLLLVPTLTIEALGLCLGLHLFGYDWSVIAQAPRWVQVTLPYAGAIIGILPALGFGMAFAQAFDEFRKRIEHDSAFVGLDRRTLWKPSVLFRKCTPGLFYGKEFLRTAIFFASTGLAFLAFGYQNLTTHITFVFLWAVLSSVLVVVFMYAALSARLVLCPIRASA